MVSPETCYFRQRCALEGQGGGRKSTPPLSVPGEHLLQSDVNKQGGSSSSQGQGFPSTKGRSQSLLSHRMPEISLRNHAQNLDQLNTEREAFPSCSPGCFHGERDRHRQLSSCCPLREPSWKQRPVGKDGWRFPKI